MRGYLRCTAGVHKSKWCDARTSLHTCLELRFSFIYRTPTFPNTPHTSKSNTLSVHPSTRLVVISERAQAFAALQECQSAEINTKFGLASSISVICGIPESLAPQPLQAAVDKKLELFIEFSKANSSWPVLIRSRPYASQLSMTCSCCPFEQACSHILLAQRHCLDLERRNEQCTDMDEGSSGQFPDGEEASLSKFEIPFAPTCEQSNEITLFHQLHAQSGENSLCFSYLRSCSQCGSLDIRDSSSPIVTVDYLYTTHGSVECVSFFSVTCLSCGRKSDPLTDFRCQVFIVSSHAAFTFEVMYEMCRDFVAGKSITSIFHDMSASYAVRMSPTTGSEPLNLHSKAPTKKQLFRSFWLFLKNMRIDDSHFTCTSCGPPSSVSAWVLDACTCGSKQYSYQQQRTIAKMREQEEHIYRQLTTDTPSNGNEADQRTFFTSEGSRICSNVVHPEIKRLRKTMRIMTQGVAALILQGVTYTVSKQKQNHEGRDWIFTREATSQLLHEVENSIQQLRQMTGSPIVKSSTGRVQPFLIWVIESADAIVIRIADGDATNSCTASDALREGQLQSM